MSFWDDSPQSMPIIPSFRCAVAGISGRGKIHPDLCGITLDITQQAAG